MTTSVATHPGAADCAPVTYADWRSAVERELAGVPLEKKLVTRTVEGIDVQPLYRRVDAPAWTAVSVAGQPPYLRGTRLADGGAWRWAASGPVEFDCSPLPALAAALARAQKGEAPDVPAVAADPLGLLVARGSLPLSLAECYSDMALGVREADQAGLPGRLIAVDAAVWHESGATAVHELAFALATGAEYWRQMLDRGLTPAVAAARMQVGFAVGVDFFMEIAKLRAARVLWAKMTAVFGAGADAQKPWLRACSARWDMTVYDAHVNLLRITTQALSAAVGGADAIEIRPFDEVAGGPSELGQRMSDNLHDILAEECAFAHQIDPAGGSWYVEALTDQLARKAWTLFQDIERDGGMAAAVLAGRPQELTAKAAEDKRVLVDSRRRPILGTTVQPNLREAPRAAATPAPEGKPARRSANPKPIRSFAALRAAAAKRTTLATLRRAWTAQRGGGPTAAALQPFRAAEAFEAVRRAGDDFLARTGARSPVFLAKMGPRAQHKARADFAGAFFSVGGFGLDGKRTFATAEEAADAASTSGARIAVLCSTDETYPQLAPVFARRLKAAMPSAIVVLAGHPGANEQAFRDAGFDEFIHVRANVRTTLARLQNLSGMLP